MDEEGRTEVMLLSVSFTFSHLPCLRHTETHLVKETILSLLLSLYFVLPYSPHVLVWLTGWPSVHSLG